MSRRYNKPPLIEALCEFQFTGEEWDWTIPGLIYQEIKDEYPKKKQANIVQFEVQAQADEVSQRVRGAGVRMQFFTADESALIQVGPHLLAVNRLQPYPHWEEFKPAIFTTLATYQKIARPTGFKRIGLRYVNRVDMPEKAFDFSTYFNFQPMLPASVPQTFSSFFMRVELPYESDRGLLLLTLGTVPDTNGGSDSLILDLDFVTLAAGELALEDSPAWIETAHERVEAAFESCITDNLRALFEEIKS